MNVEKLRRLQSQVRIGGKGTARRKKKVMHQTATTDDKKLQSSLKKLSVSTIPGIEEVNIIKDDLTVIHFNNPKAQASLSANTFAVTGHGETKKIVEMLPEILPQLGQETVVQLRMFANSMTGAQKTAGTIGGSDATASTNMLYSVVEEDDVPMLVSDFDEVAKMEAMKLREPRITTNDKPAIERIETKGESAAVLPPLLEVESNEKGNNVQQLENRNLIVKSSWEEESEFQNETEFCIRKQGINTEKEKFKTGKQNVKTTKDVGKAKETQKKIDNKSQQNQEPSRQMSRSEGKTQKPSKDKKPEDIALKAMPLKTERNREVGEYNKSEFVNDAAVIASENPEQVTGRSTNLKDNKDHKQTKQIQQKQQKKSVKQEPPATPETKGKKQEPFVDKQEKNTKQDLNIQQKEAGIKEKEDKKIEKQDEHQQLKTTLDSNGDDVLQGKIAQHLDDQGQTQILCQQQQQKNESPIKQKNKQPQQKQQNQHNQNKPHDEKGFKRTESLPKSAKQDEKEILKTSKEKPADKSVETKKKSNEKQSEDTKRNLKEASPNQKTSEIQIKSSEQAKEVMADAGKGFKTVEPLPDSAKQDEKQQQQSDSVDKANEKRILLKGLQEFVKEEVDSEKPENQHAEKTIKHNISSIETGKQAEKDIHSADVSIKTVALQSLESSEKMLQIVNEITKDLLIENLNKLSEETIKEGSRNDLPPDQEKPAAIAVKSVLTEELLPKTFAEETPEKKLNTDNQKSKSPLSKTSMEVVQDLGNNINLLNKNSDVKGAVIANEQLPSIVNEIVANNPSISETNVSKVSENNEKSEAVEQQVSHAEIPQPQHVTTPEFDPLGERLAKQPSLAEIVQLLPPAIPLPTAEIPANNNRINEVNNDLSKLIAIDPAHRQPSMAEILQSQPPTILPVEVLSLPNNIITGEINDIQMSQILNKEDVKELQLDSNVANEEAVLIQPQDQGAISPELSTSSTANVSVNRQITEEKSTFMPITPKQKTSPPKQNTKMDEAKLKLVTKPQTGQQHQQQQVSKAKSKPANNNKPTPTTPATPTTPTTPTKIPLEKGISEKQKPTILATKAAPDLAAKKTNSPQKQQQTDTSSKSKSTSGASTKHARLNTGNSRATSSTTKKANTPPAGSKTNPNTGGKQQDINVKGTASRTQTVAEQPSSLLEAKSAPTSGTTTTTLPTPSPTIENTLTSNKQSFSK